MKFDDNFHKRISMARQSLNLTQEDLAKKVGVVRRQIAAYEGGESKPRIKVLNNLSAALGTSIEWLTHGEGESPDLSNIKKTVTIREIPVISISNAYDYLHAGDEKSNNCISGFIPAPTLANNDSFSIEVTGDSMTSFGVNFPEGTIVTFERQIRPRYGDFVLVSHQLERRVYFMQYISNTDNKYFRPLNPIYPSIPVDIETDILAVAIHYQLDLRDGDPKHLFVSPYLPVNPVDEELAWGDLHIDIPQDELDSINNRLNKIESMLEQLLNKKAP
ncbi:helix-turn-helix domain-containing protein [Xenorhabdus littoralis]|uniref:helix-turn-helix domain-containing protein n=1 Tax=Xenorhabdus littoralis TaxID=2582835 RepID=UPI0029E7E56B|nr:XRE family transcriptional regulator [Xenorhabdus sp. psl]MDX7993256.1 helix-turn-helix domain-containing protein [Xenorhabdus sp. psl]